MNRKIILNSVILGIICTFFTVTTVCARGIDKNKLKQYGRITSKPALLDNPDIETVQKKTPKSNKIQARLQNIISKTLTDKSAAPTALDAIGKKNIRIILDVDKKNMPNLNAIKSHNATIIKEREGMLAVEIPVEDIESVVNVNGVKGARLPKKFRAYDVMSEGSSLIGAPTFHDAGYSGEGVHVAVIDIGFKGLTEAQANGDLPFNVIATDYTENGLETEYVHGTACAEIVHDVAPQAQLYLFKVSDEIDISKAYDYCINNGIDIISSSIGTIGSGPGDGTGPIAQLCDDARDAGILVVNAAGNYANTEIATDLVVGTHWKGVFADSGMYDAWDDGTNEIHLFIPGDIDSFANAIMAVPYFDDDGNPETSEVSIVMRWNDWPWATTDYDMYLFTYDKPVTLIASSFNVQDGSQPPLEEIVVDLPGSIEYAAYVLVITKKAGSPAGTELEVFLGGTSCFMPFYEYDLPIATSESSICEPADAESVLSVGAIDYADWLTGPKEDYSSEGPTNAWAGSSARVKPDVCAPDYVSTCVYGEFAFPGTSAAAPHVAGMAALILSAHPDLSVDDLADSIVHSAVDMGDEGKDNLYGEGKVEADVNDVLKGLTVPFITANMDENRQDDVVVNFGPNYGIWVFFNNSTWQQLHTVSPKQMVKGNIDNDPEGKEDLIIDFGATDGIWIYYNNSTWIQLHALSARHLETGDLNIEDTLDEIIIDFGPDYGIWVYYPDTTSWVQIHELSSEFIIATKQSTDHFLCIDFGDEYGIWLRFPSGAWELLHEMSPERGTSTCIDGDDYEEGILDFGDEYGIWIFDAPDGQWSQLHNLSAESLIPGNFDENFIVNSSGNDIVIDFGNDHGVWAWYNNDSWSQVHRISPEWIISGDLDGNTQDDMIMDFGAENGIWVKYNNSTWEKLHDLSP